MHTREVAIAASYVRLVGRAARAAGGARATLAWMPLFALLVVLPGLTHAAAQPITVPFDHLATGFELDGVHRDLPCESCHVNAVFKGTPRDCGTCHIKGSVFDATPKSINHLATTNRCNACHNTIAFRPAITFDHTEALGTCQSCHNGVTAVGKAPSHPPTSDQCSACHSVMSWTPPTSVDHTQIPLAQAGFCIICHNGVQAMGKNASHIATTLECGDCHLTTSWLGASFDHTGITTGCYGCHNGTRAVGKQGNHMPTSNACEDCHRTGIGSKSPSWVPSLFDHTQMAVSTCATCHGGTTKISTGLVESQPVNHVPPIPAVIDCGVCHGNVPTAETWSMLAASIATLHTGLPVSNCLMCHANETFAGVPAPYIPMSTLGVSPYKATPLSPPHIPVLPATDCSACHGAAYQSGGFGPATAMTSAKHAYVSTTCDTCHDTGKAFYVGSGTPLQLRPADHVSSTDPRMAASDCGQCHTTASWVSNVLPEGHMPNPANLACTTCHAAAPSDYTSATLSANSVLHTGISGSCGLCHGNTSAALTWFNNFTPKDAILSPVHIPYLSGTDCSACHGSTTYAAGTFGPMNMTAAKHAFVPASCDTCHEAGLSFYMGAAAPALQGRPADHTSGAMAAPNDCSGCHNTSNWASNAMPAGHMPNPGNQACPICHTGDLSTTAGYAQLASIAVLHTGISNGCQSCHGGPSGQLTFYNNNDNPKAAAGLVPPHIPYNTGSDCSVCHAASYVTGGFGPATAMSAAKHAYVPTTCDTCHEAGLSFDTGSGTPLQTRPASHTSSPPIPTMATADCNQCHDTTNWNDASPQLPAGHMPNPANQVCSTCHTGNLTTAAGFAQLASIPVLHTGIGSGCAQCHGGAAALTFYNNNDNPLSAATLSPPHIPAFTGEDCGACHTANYSVGGFGPMNMTQATHAGVGSTCNSCHEAGLSFYMGAANPKLQGRPADHTTGQMAAPNDCSLCHTTANWNSTALPTGHMPNPAAQSCTLCHTAAPNDYSTATLAANAVLHTGIAGGCGTCHGGTTALTWYQNFTPKDAVLTPAHIPYLAGTDCSSCHSSTTYAAGGFGPMNMTQAKHAFVATTCDSCHEAGLSFYMGTASPTLQGRPADHSAGQMAAPNDCSLCHTTANWNSTVLPTGHMPNPANQACTVCHTHAPTDYSTATLAANAALHTGITSGCITCHGAPNATPPVFYLNYTPKDAVLTPVHIPTASTPCESCHAVSFTSFSGTAMSAAKHTTLFTYIGSTCDACHNAVTPALSFYGVSNLTTRPSSHNSGSKKTADCSQCHNPNGWDGGAAAKKAAVPTAGKSTITAVAAAPTASSSIAAAATTATLPSAAGGRTGALAMRGGGLSHAGVVADCSACHDGVLASGRSATHIASNALCQNCHLTSAWLPARFEHQGINGLCSSCHNGVAAVGKPVQHVLAQQDCAACHGTVSFTTVRVDHIGLHAACASCHDGVAAVGKQPRHVATARDCSACHSIWSWDVPVAAPAQRPANPHRSAAPGSSTP